MNEIAYDVPDVSCQHCVIAVSEERTQVPGVDWLRTAIENAGYEAR